ncbi:Bug family tripartite tricarboxylate transporter substrate binding protein [Cupriavidus sp. IDO]|uniref:Bug family tripartite tricarboxylate transporter substrate binding protein n=1 Tax=Cupriavidus sp. IDO TaxID=1539142 RepID=UPI0005796A54|nr:tripartite tricarboxylate transporter substrate binding protein [Cupriavidus sp. IDO]KWR88665.1 LacI family transcriptional regulator [Cupriavidus sp. IDO]
MKFQLRRRRVLALPVAAGLFTLTKAWTSHAATFPSKPIRMIVPFPAGGATDIVARPFAQMLGEELKQPIVVDNRGGAGGSIGAAAVASSPPDGYTLLFGSVGTNAINPSLYKNLSYNVARDFTPLATVASAPVAIVVNARSGFLSLAELIAKAKTSPGSINFGSAGNGTPGHLVGSMFSTRAGIRLMHVPYKGSAPAITELLGGQISLMFDPLQSVLPHIQSGKLKVLAITSRERIKVLPNVPTVAESGFPDFEATAWWALYAPAGLPAGISQKLVADTQRVVQSSGFGNKLAAMGLQPMSSPLADFQKSETAKWGEAVRTTGITIE